MEPLREQEVEVEAGRVSISEPQSHRYKWPPPRWERVAPSICPDGLPFSPAAFVGFSARTHDPMETEPGYVLEEDGGVKATSP